MVMTQPIEHLTMAGPYRSAGGTTATSEDTPAFWKYCYHFATILIVASFILVGLLHSGAIAETVQEGYFSVLRSIGVVFGFTAAMLPTI